MMQAMVQFFSKKGFYGDPVLLKATSVKGIWDKLDKAFDSVPDKCEDEKLIDWTKITIEIIRE